eukprot:jgi/Orpsp1_1/1174185/evm.model.c7180000049192.1
MASTLNEIYAQLPSPPLSPNKLCVGIDQCLYDQFIYSEEELNKKEESLMMNSPVECPVQLSKDEILRNKFIGMMDEGVEMNGQMVEFAYAIEKLHSIGNKVINKKTKDAVPLRVFETGKDIYQEYWVHPMFLSLHSYQFFKLFEEIKENNEQGVIEIEVPSLKAFAFVLYYIYTGDNAKFNEVAKLDQTYFKGVLENIECLEV